MTDRQAWTVQPHAGEDRARQTREPSPRLSEVFKQLSAQASGPVSVERIRSALGDRSFAAMLIFFAVINLLPLPPGTTLVLGLPLMLVSAQMLLGAKIVWLPRRVLNYAVPEAQFRQLSSRIVPRLEWLEKFIRPRIWPMPDRYDERIIGGMSLIMATLVTLPIPLGNWFPALTIAIAGLALSERDGWMLGASGIVGIFSLGLVATVIGTTVTAAKMAVAALW